MFKKLVLLASVYSCSSEGKLLRDVANAVLPISSEPFFVCCCYILLFFFTIFTKSSEKSVQMTRNCSGLSGVFFFIFYRYERKVCKLFLKIRE